MPNPTALLCSDANQQLDASVAKACRIILPQASKCSPLPVLGRRAYSWQLKCLGDSGQMPGSERSNSSQLNTNRGKKNPKLECSGCSCHPGAQGQATGSCLARGSTSPPLKPGFCSQLPSGLQRHYLNPAGEEEDRAHHVLRDPGTGWFLFPLR